MQKEKKCINSILGLLSQYSYEQEGCANGYVHKAAIRMRINILRLTMSFVNVYETGFVKEPDGLREEAPPQSQFLPSCS